MRRTGFSIVVGLLFAFGHPGSAADSRVAPACTSPFVAKAKTLVSEGIELGVAACPGTEGRKVLVQRVSGNWHVVQDLGAPDPGLETLRIKVVAGRTFVVYTNVVEPTSDEGTHQVSVLEVRESSAHVVGAWWSYDAPSFVSDHGNAYLVVSTNPYGWTVPSLPGWPAVFALDPVGTKQVPLDEAPFAACDVVARAQAFFEPIPAGENALLQRMIKQLSPYCRQGHEGAALWPATGVSLSRAEANIPEAEIMAVVEAAESGDIRSVRRLQEYYFLYSDQPNEGIRWLRKGADLHDFSSLIGLVTSDADLETREGCGRAEALLARAEPMADNAARERQLSSAIELVERACEAPRN